MVKGTTKHVSFAIEEEEEEEKKQKHSRLPMKRSRRRQRQQQMTESILVERVMENPMLPRITRALIMGAVPMIMLLAMMQLATTSTSIEHTLDNPNGKIIEDISIAALSEDQQGLWTIKLATKSFDNDIHVKEGEERPSNRAWKFSLSMIIPSEKLEEEQILMPP